MTIKRRPRPGWGRKAAAAAAAALILYLISATASSSTAQGALEALGARSDLAVALLRRQLGDSRGKDAIPASLALAIGQSPVLLAAREDVLELRRTEEADDGGDPQRPQEPVRPDTEQTGPIQEDPAQPETPLLFADNGVPARTLVPTSPEGYVVTGDVYINSRSDREFDASIFDGTFAAALSEEEGPQILIVHTHGSEAYTMPAGQEYVPSSDSRTTDSRFNVVRVGEELKKTLEEAGLTVLHDETLHDYPEYSGAYNRSLSSVEEYLREYPTIAYVLDIHRDAISDSEGNPYKVVSAAAGVNAAQMSLVIGTDGGGLEHPDWQENLKLAAALQQRITDSFPTLMRPITVRNSRYNQHVTPGCLLIEMGAAGNSLDEALLSARLLGEQLGALIVEKG